MEKKAKIFMVDDDADLVMVVKSVFEANGYEVASAGSAKEAIETIDSVNPDLLIIDVMMEDMQAGFRLVNHLRNTKSHPEAGRFAKVPILMLTSVQQKTKIKFSEDVGDQLLHVDTFMEKPVKPRQLLDKVAELLKK